MLFRLASLAVTFSALTLAAQPETTPVFSGQLFPNQSKTVKQLTEQAIDERVQAAITGKQAEHEKTNPTRMPFVGYFAPGKPNPFTPQGQIARVFPAIKNERTFCAVPLLETKGKDTQDKIEKSLGKTQFDSMTVPTPVPVCKDWNK